MQIGLPRRILQRLIRGLSLKDLLFPPADGSRVLKFKLRQHINGRRLPDHRNRHLSDHGNWRRSNHGGLMKLLFTGQTDDGMILEQTADTLQTNKNRSLQQQD